MVRNMEETKRICILGKEIDQHKKSCQKWRLNSIGNIGNCLLLQINTRQPNTDKRNRDRLWYYQWKRLADFIKFKSIWTLKTTKVKVIPKKKMIDDYFISYNILCPWFNAHVVPYSSTLYDSFILEELRLSVAAKLLNLRQEYIR